jgi:hypothetical protein
MPISATDHPATWEIRRAWAIRGWRSLGRRLLYLVSRFVSMDELLNGNESLWERFPGIETAANGYQ